MFRPKFTITNNILGNVGKIEAAREVIENSPLVPAWEAKFRQEAVIRAVHYGTHIEGNDLSFTEAKDVLEGKEVTARERDIQEVLNYRGVVDYINKEGTKERPLDTEMLLQIHQLTVNKLVPEDQVGSFRQVPVVVKGVKTGQVTYSPPPPAEVEKLVEDLLSWVNYEEAKEISPLLRAGVVMYEIVRIHPFTEGNGRTARALATLLLFKEDYDVKRFFSLEEYYDEDIGAYYDALQAASKQLISDESERDLTSWLEYFIEGLAIEINRIKDKVKKLSVDLRLKGKQGQIVLNERQIKLIEYMDQYGQITNKEWRALLPMVSDDTILREMKDLLKKKLVRKKGSTKAAIYLLK
ncbi:MAG: Fic family protein [bacterium]|nr:Fic family protein [bacterium]